MPPSSLSSTAAKAAAKARSLPFIPTDRSKKENNSPTTPPNSPPRPRPGPSRPPPARVPSDTAPLYSASAVELDEECDCSESQATRGPFFWCAACECTFCEICWNAQRAHKKGPTRLSKDKTRSGPSESSHEKTDIEVARRLNATFRPPESPKDQEQLHRADEATTWFGVVKYKEDRRLFQDHGRFASLLAQSSSGVHVRYPHLVSFVGQAGHGKSTLIKLLIEQKKQKMDISAASSYPAPIVGIACNDMLPTTGEVHLYADPASFNTNRPILYADSEGLEGGEKLPISAHHREQEQTQHKSYQPRNVVRRVERELIWASTIEKKKREFAVAQLYPRILYTFSDVIVFVLNNVKVVEATVINRLIDWASACIEKSTNQFTLPHAIIALNASPVNVDAGEWDVGYATKKLLQIMNENISENEVFQKYVRKWSNKGKSISSMEDLLRCFYSSIRVVRIPDSTKYSRVEQQVAKLYHEIQHNCTEANGSKRVARTLSDADELHVYLQSAFSHFAASLETPFNFIEVAFKNNPIPLDFGGSILKLAIAIRDATRDLNDALEGKDGRYIFSQLSRMVGSCVFLDCYRQNGRGSVVNLLMELYMKYCLFALNDFCDLFWTCEYRHPTSFASCVNVKNGHTKQHQDKTGKIIGAGHYTANFTEDSFKEEWISLLQSHVRQCQDEFETLSQQRPNEDVKLVASRIHQENMQAFFNSLGGAHRFFSNSTCFCCLRGTPEHALPCGHILCSSCITTYGQKVPPSNLAIAILCPLHGSEMMESRVPSIVRHKPELAGVRILSLDGGGIRGVLELQALKEIELQLGGEIPVQEFFDLILGTSTGGLIALGLGVEKWRVDHCITMFKRLASHAFTPRTVFDVFSGINTNSRYRTRPFEEALQTAFREESSLFGGNKEFLPKHNDIKVGVIAATETTEQAVLMSNYNRAPHKDLTYCFLRPDNPRDELRVWEAARATAAAPTYFKPFVNSRTKQGYLDGAIFYNNPVHIAYLESQRIWPDTRDRHPDVLLSLGTGHNGADSSPTDATLESYEKPTWPRSSAGPRLSHKASTISWWKRTSIGRFLIVMAHRVENILNAEVLWYEFMRWIPRLNDDSQRQRYIRLNLGLGYRPPRLDDTQAMPTLLETAEFKFKQGAYRKLVSRISFQLLASSFYFHREKTSENERKVTGHIRCRFETEHLRALGRQLAKFQVDHCRPRFQIEERGYPASRFSRLIGEGAINQMMNWGRFDLGSFDIEISADAEPVMISLVLFDEVTRMTTTTPISGFPRSLVLDREEIIGPDITVTGDSTSGDGWSSRPHSVADYENNLTVGTPPRTDHRYPHESSSSPEVPSPATYLRRPQSTNDWLDRRSEAASSAISSTEISRPSFRTRTGKPISELHDTSSRNETTEDDSSRNSLYALSIRSLSRVNSSEHGPELQRPPRSISELPADRDAVELDAEPHRQRQVLVELEAEVPSSVRARPVDESNYPKVPLFERPMSAVITGGIATEDDLQIIAAIEQFELEASRKYWATKHQNQQSSSAD